MITQTGALESPCILALSTRAVSVSVGFGCDATPAALALSAPRDVGLSVAMAPAADEDREVSFSPLLRAQAPPVRASAAYAMVAILVMTIRINTPDPDGRWTSAPELMTGKLKIAVRHDADGIGGHVSCLFRSPRLRLPAARGEPHHLTTVTDWYHAAGPLMPSIAATALLGGLVVIERVYAISVRGRGGGSARTFIERSLQLVRSGRIDDAIAMATGSRTAIADIGLLILRSRTTDLAELRTVAATAELALAPRLRLRLRLLPALAIVASLLGLIGLAVGLEPALRAASLPLAAPALNPLVAGAAIAAALTLIHAALAVQADAVADDMREYAARLIAALTDRPDVRLGHR